MNDDGTAEGRIVGNVAFMFLRDQRIYASIDDEECDQTTARASHTSVAPYNVAGDYDACLAISMKVSGCSVITVPDSTAELIGTLWFVDPDTDSWASLHYQPNARTYPIRQSGPRNLWDEIETAYHWWREAGRPGPARSNGGSPSLPKASKSPSSRPAPQPDPRPDPLMGLNRHAVRDYMAKVRA